MRTNFAMKTLADVCLYFSILSMLWYWKDAQFLFTGTIILVGAGCYIGSSLSNKGFFRFIGVVPILCAFFLPATMYEYIAIAPPVIYGLITVGVGTITIDYWKYLLYFKITVAGELFLWFFTGVSKQNIEQVVMYGLSYIAIAIFTLNLVRYNAKMGAKGQAMVAALIFAPGAISVLVGAVAKLLASFGATILYGVLIPFGYAYQKIIDFYVWATDCLTKPTGSRVITQMSTQSTESSVVASGNNPVEEITESASGMTWVEPVVAIIAIFIVICIVIFVIKLIGGIKAEEDYEVEKEEIGQRVNSPKKKKRISFRFNNRQKIRRLYKKYLKLMQKKGYFKKSSSTSKDIYAATKDYMDEQTGKDIRKHYIKARYGETDITDAEVKAVSKLIKDIN